MSCCSLTTFKTLSLLLRFDSLITICLSVGLFGLTLVGVLLAS